MNSDPFKKRLLAEEHRLLRGLSQAESNEKELGDQPVGDAADSSVSGDLKEEQFRLADTDWHLLRQVRDALQRIEQGTYGRCAVDGGPIEEKRLEAMPWTRYCMKHQSMRESADPPHSATL